MSKKQKDLDIKFTYAEFAYNRAPHNTMKASLNEVVYGVSPLMLIELLSIQSKNVLNKDASKLDEMMLILHD